MDGPVVALARKALETGNANYVLPWVAPGDEPEIKAAFEHTRQVRALGPEARELADYYFFETLVRVHRAGEGAPYTGLKPAGAEVNPAVAAADKALETGSPQELISLLTKTVQEGIVPRFEQARALQDTNINQVQARREGVHAYVEFTHYAEGIYNAALPGTAPEAQAPQGHEHH